MINWKVRIKNRLFWVTIIPAVIVLIQLIADLFGFSLDLGEIGNKLLGIVDAVFIILGILGVVVDPTTKGVEDSAQAMTYEYPKEGNIWQS